MASGSGGEVGVTVGSSSRMRDDREQQPATKGERCSVAYKRKGDSSWGERDASRTDRLQSLGRDTVDSVLKCSD